MKPPRRRPVLPAVCAALLLLTGCEGLSRAQIDPEAERAEAASASPFDQQSLNEIMLTVAGDEEAVSYFREALSRDADNPDLRRGLARSLARAGMHGEARLVWRELVEADQAEPADRVEYALSLARLGMWDAAEAQLALLPPGDPGPRRLTLMALMADHRGDWAAADAAYERAREATAEPGALFNNWGVSRLARGDYAEAERLFERALVYDPDLFSAKNNLALSYGLQGRYRLPLITLSGEEEAVLLHNLGVIALRRGERDVARSMLERAVAAHPRHYAPAADKLAALGAAGG
jgi:Flp pilus assembly protein TadD